MAEKKDEEEDLEEVLEGETDQQVTGKEDADEFLEEHYDDLEAVLDYKAEELGLTQKKINDKKKRRPPKLSEDEKKRKQNYLKQLKIRDELDHIIQEASRRKDPHYMHEYIAFIIGSGFISMGFLYNKVFLTFYVIGMLVTLRASISFLGSNDTKLVRIIRNHPFWYVLSGVVTTIMFLGAGYSFPVIDLSLTELVVTTLIGG